MRFILFLALGFYSFSAFAAEEKDHAAIRRVVSGQITPRDRGVSERLPPRVPMKKPKRRTKSSEDSAASKPASATPRTSGVVVPGAPRKMRATPPRNGGVSTGTPPPGGYEDMYKTPKVTTSGLGGSAKATGGWSGARERGIRQRRPEDPYGTPGGTPSGTSVTTPESGCPSVEKGTPPSAVGGKWGLSRRDYNSDDKAYFKAVEEAKKAAEKKKKAAEKAGALSCDESCVKEASSEESKESEKDKKDKEISSPGKLVFSTKHLHQKK